MSRMPSDATQLRNVRREVKALKAERAQLVGEREQYRARATKAELEAADWRRRFDMLLLRTPPLAASQPLPKDDAEKRRLYT